MGSNYVASVLSESTELVLHCDNEKTLIPIFDDERKSNFSVFHCILQIINSNQIFFSIMFSLLTYTYVISLCIICNLFVIANNNNNNNIREFLRYELIPTTYVQTK